MKIVQIVSYYPLHLGGTENKRNIRKFSKKRAPTSIIPSTFFKLIRIPKNSIIHVHIAQAFVPEIIFLVSKLRGIPYIAHIHLDAGPSTKVGF